MIWIRRRWLLLLLGVVGAGLSIAMAMQQNKSGAATEDMPIPQDSKPAFDGKTLAGWHPQGQAAWRVQHGEVVGTVAQGGSGGWLVLTARRLVFRSHGKNFQNAPFELAVADIAQVETTRTLGLPRRAVLVAQPVGVPVHGRPDHAPCRHAPLPCVREPASRR